MVARQTVDRLWTGQPVRHAGTHYRVDGLDWAALCHPPPLQQPRIPVWVGGTWPGTRPFRRAAAWDGWSRCGWTGGGRSRTPAPSPATCGPAARVSDPSTSSTWRVEAVHPWRYGCTERTTWPLAAMHERILAGP